MGTLELHKFADTVLSIRPTNQAAEHGWAHLARQCPAIRNSLAFETKYEILNILSNAPILFDKIAPNLKLLASRRTRRARKRSEALAPASAGQQEAREDELQRENAEIPVCSSSSEDSSDTEDDASSANNSSDTCMSEVQEDPNAPTYVDLPPEESNNDPEDLDMGFSDAEESESESESQVSDG